jgi:DNA-binding CsgD family transcriptional regulator
VSPKPSKGRPPLPRGRRPRLTQRESVVLGLVAADWTNREIAAQLSVSEQSVAYHVGKLLAKFGTRSRTGLVAKAYAAGYLLVDAWPPRLDEGLDATGADRA